MAEENTSPFKVTGASLKEDEIEAATPMLEIAEGLPYTEGERDILRSQLEQQGECDYNNVSLWRMSTLPLLVSMVRKVLELAAGSCEANGNNTTTTHDYGINNTHSSGVAASGSTPGEQVNAPVTTQTPSKMDLFLEENAYIVEQLQLQQWPFFTLPRLLELLANPFTYNSDLEGKLRGEKLQAAIRRCVLVSAPMITAEANDYGDWR